jgi:septal ring factor EnvC (AmiA/AmiB activator)
MNAMAPVYMRPPRTPSWVLRHIVAPLLVAIVISTASYAIGLGRSEAVHAVELARIETDVAALEHEKVGKDQFAEFQRSVDDLKNETRQLRRELVATREALLARR